MKNRNIKQAKVKFDTYYSGAGSYDTICPVLNFKVSSQENVKMIDIMLLNSVCFKKAFLKMKA